MFAALNSGVPGTKIVVNGVGKHHWLKAFSEPNLTVNFDSVSEIKSLIGQGINLCWHFGIRVAVSPMIDPDSPEQPAQFGMSEEDISEATDILHSNGVKLEVLHFHLRSNVYEISDYRTAVEECFHITQKLALTPRYLDIGGGIPDPDVKQTDNEEIEPDYVIKYAKFIVESCNYFKNLEGLFLENGRYILGPAGALVISVIDTKVIRGRRFVICDGGRTNQALESDWEEHKVVTLEKSEGSQTPTTICGPNCMAYDWIYRGDFPESVKEGSIILYLNAGAYHLPWETRFSRGLCRVLWSQDGKNVSEIRPPEDSGVRPF